MPKKGYKQSKEHIEKIAQKTRGRKDTIDTKQKKSRVFKGKTYKEMYRDKADKHKQKNSQGHLGKNRSDKTKEKISKSLEGHIVTEETKEKLRDYKGYLASNWQDGKSLEPYGVDWTETLRRSIRERDHYICQLCNQLQSDIAHDVHHIDYNKENNNPNNLITLCHNCHSKTHHNRKYWIKYFKKEECVNLTGGYPRCFTMIKPKTVAEAVVSYYEGGMLTY